ncbi:MAG: hypothetical protein KDD58_03210, partial [Bdellovibrionales bacterium]|nr:hypothetical protein [Bdellovibrionales bacterium]
VFLQDNNFSDLKNPSLIKQNAEKLTQILGEKVSEENYQEILNKKFKDIFGLHFQKDVPIVTKKKAKPKNNSSALDEYSYLSSGSSSSSSDSKTNGDLKNKVNFTRKGLKDMFCPGETKERSAIQIYKDNYDRQGKARPNTYEASILDPAESSNYDGIDPSLKQCMQEGLAFAKKQDHLKLKNGEECYPPIIGQRPMKANGNYPATYDTRVPIMGTENGFYCGYSAEVKQHEGRDYIRFFHPNVRTFERNPMFDRKGVKEYSFVFIANDIRERGCNRSDCDDGYAKTYAYYQNQCSLKAIQEAEKIQKIKKSGGDSKVSN